MLNKEKRKTRGSWMKKNATRCQMISFPDLCEHTGARGPVRARTTRRTAKFLACCVRRAPGVGQAAHGRPGLSSGRIRPRQAASLASSRAQNSSPWPAAAVGGSRRMGRPSATRHGGAR
eukprot:scaffold61113_cov36-Phaeocystis_antarctica.AAC.1